jgi:hypothetical protein
MSLCRAMRRQRARKNGTVWKGPDQQVRHLPCGGYETLRPTKGWIRVSGPRLVAQQRMSEVRAYWAKSTS